MAISLTTVEAIVQLMLKRGYLSPGRLRQLVRDLEEVPGNASFRESVKRLSERVNALGLDGTRTGPAKSSGLVRKSRKSGSTTGGSGSSQTDT